MVHTFLHRTEITAPPDAVWEFFSNPRNLARITPPGIGFENLTADLPDRVHEGLMILHRVRPLLGIPMLWLSEITHVTEGKRFIDEQRIGPYALWHHEHEFHDAGGGQTRIVDRVTYVMPFGWAGDIVRPILVAPQLTQAFAFRERALRDLFPE